MKTTLLRLIPLALASFGGAAAANDFPTVDRVNYVMECMRTHPGSHFEMVSKCSCAVDALAKQIKYADYVELSTATNANSIGGERGSYIRDVDVLQVKIKRYRELQTRAKQGCFINLDTK
jgi:hypothetical protein